MYEFSIKINEADFDRLTSIDDIASCESDADKMLGVMLFLGRVVTKKQLEMNDGKLEIEADFFEPSGDKKEEFSKRRFLSELMANYTFKEKKIQESENED